MLESVFLLVQLSRSSRATEFCTAQFRTFLPPMLDGTECEGIRDDWFCTRTVVRGV